ncbi:helical backbone metal receptor [Fulvivirgaceae bacterium BMA12]|uniref:Helical backbone metal receptor n=1 Tax=Agaribacillus aureus TaxID=3051825 RepID=A0ABT8L7S3_9BACT|nr:helical backbone metal receptor [Fulvivirgaceae bacterium BMA12]
MKDHRKSVTDQMGNKVDVPANPERIISLVPSQTELLFDLGLEKALVGVTKFCIHLNPQVREKIKIGGTKKFHFDRITQLAPDLIIGNKEENYREGIERLKRFYPVWMSDISNLEDNRMMITAVGQICNRPSQAHSITGRIDKLLHNFEPVTNKSVLYFIWRKPFMAVGGGTYIHEILNLCGFNNVMHKYTRYPELSADQIKAYNPEVILLSSEPYPFKAQHIAEFESLCPNAKILLVDGEMFSWFGSRLIKALPYFQQLKPLLH